MSNWQKIPRKLRAGLVQIVNCSLITISEETKKELLRQDLVKYGIRYSKNKYVAYSEWGLIPTNNGKDLYSSR